MRGFFAFNEFGHEPSTETGPANVCYPGNTS